MNNRPRRYLALVLARCTTVSFAQQEDVSNVEITVSKVAGNVYMLQGAGGNVGVAVGEERQQLRRAAEVALKLQDVAKGDERRFAIRGTALLSRAMHCPLHTGVT